MGERMKKATLLFLLFVCILGGCGKKEQLSDKQQDEMQPYAEPFYYADGFGRIY